MMHARCGGLDPALEAVAFPGVGSQPQDHARRLHEEHAQVAIAALGDLRTASSERVDRSTTNCRFAIAILGSLSLLLGVYRLWPFGIVHKHLTNAMQPSAKVTTSGCG